jgi:MarR family transcriptional regulator, organic hydroperoxide resistance regulator
MALTKKKKIAGSAHYVESSPPATVATEPFPPLTTSLPAFVKDGSDRALRRLIYDLTGMFNQMLSNRKAFAAFIGMTEAQLLMITIIAEAQKATVSQIAKQLSVTSQFVTIEIGDLVRKKIVEKRPNETDRRSMFLHLTEKGRNLLRELAPIRRRVNDIHWRSLTDERARLLQEMIETLTADGKIAHYELNAPEMQGRKAPSLGTAAQIQRTRR